MSSNSLEASNESFKEAITEEINSSQIAKIDNNVIDKNIADNINDNGDKIDQDNEIQDNNNENNVNEINKNPEEEVKEEINKENEKIDDSDIKEIEKEEENNVDKEVEHEEIEKEVEEKKENIVENIAEKEVEKVIDTEKEVNEAEVEEVVEKEIENEKENIPDNVVDKNENNGGESEIKEKEGENENKDKEDENIPAIVVDDVDNNEEGGETKNKEEEKGEEKEKAEENIADNLEIKGEFHDIFNKNLTEPEDTTELKRTLSNLYDKIKILSKDNINTVGISDEKDKDYELNELHTKEKTSNTITTEDDLNKYYQSFSGTLQRFKPMTMPSTELCNTINNRYHNNINIQEFFEHLEKITTQNAYAINNSLSSLVSLMHGPSRSSSSQLDITSGNSATRGDSLRHPKKGLNNQDAGLSKNFRNFFKYSKKKFNHNNTVFVSNITNDTIPIPNITVPNIPSVEELPMRDPLSLGIYYHNHQKYDIADYYFTLSSIDNNALGLYLHGMYIKYGHGISGCSPELGFQYLLKSAEASIQSIPTINKNNIRMASTLGTIDEDHNLKKGSETDLYKTNKIPLKESKEEEPSELVAEKMLMKTNIANMLTNLTDEEFETWIVRCIVSLPIYEIGQSFLHGHGVPKSTSKAVYCFNVAAYMGDADAQLALAQCYKLGIGVKKTRKMAAMWYRKAHANGKCIFGESWVWKSKYDKI